MRNEKKIKKRANVEKLKELDKKVLTGTILTVAFLILYLATLPFISYSDALNQPSSEQLSAQSKADLESLNWAVMMRDKAQCDKILNNSMRRECMEITPDPEIAKQIDTNAADLEAYNLAIMMNDASMCDTISDNVTKEECTSFIAKQADESAQSQQNEDEENLRRSRLYKDFSYCESIMDEPMKEECLSGWWNE